MRDAGTSLADEAYRDVRQRILDGEFKLGQPVSRRKIANELGMSFLPVSEALLRLEVEGLLESRPRAGTRVRIPRPEDVEGHYIVREALEVQAARLFALVSTAQERAELQALAARLDEIAGQESEERPDYRELHNRLHRGIAAAARCAALSEAIEQTRALASIWMCDGRGRAHESRRHQQLMEALSSGDPYRAAEAMREHIRSSRQESLERLEPYFRLEGSGASGFRRAAEPQALSIEAHPAD
jgi:DNA-binding GntR family transcriptional regulator